MIAHLLFSFFAAAGDKCTLAKGSFLNFPTWYHYLSGIQVQSSSDPSHPAFVCNPTFGSLSDIWLVVAAVIEILLRIAALAAVGFVIYGGFNYITSQGEADKTGRAKNTITDALIGLLITVIAATVVSFVARSIK